MPDDDGNAGPREAQTLLEQWLPKSVQADDLIAIGAVIPTNDGPAPALMLGWTAHRPDGERVLVAAPILIIDPQATILTTIEGGLRHAYDGEDELRAAGITPAEKAQEIADQVVICSGPCRRRLFGARADLGVCVECEPESNN